MTLSTLLIHILLTSLFCVGLRIVSSKINGDPMILYFLRWPYEWLEYQIKELKEENKFIHLYDFEENKDYILLFRSLIYILKPFIGCVYCMASVYTFVVWYLINGPEVFAWSMVSLMIVNIFATAAINGILYNVFEVMLLHIRKLKDAD